MIIFVSSQISSKRLFCWILAATDPTHDRWSRKDVTLWKSMRHSQFPVTLWRFSSINIGQYIHANFGCTFCQDYSRLKSCYCVVKSKYHPFYISGYRQKNPCGIGWVWLSCLPGRPKKTVWHIKGFLYASKKLCLRAFSWGTFGGLRCQQNKVFQFAAGGNEKAWSHFDDGRAWRY